MTRFAVSLFAASILLSLSASPASAQTKKAVGKAKPAAAKTVEAPIAPVCPLLTGEIPVFILTSAGALDVVLDIKRAPITTKNFLRYVDEKRLDGASFYRVLKMSDNPADPQGLIQAGQRMPGKALPPIAHEPTSQTGLSHIRGALSMARGAPGTATNDFFILASDMKGLDADPAKTSGDNLGYAVFGQVVMGMDVVKNIFNQRIDPGKGPMVGQMLDEPVKIVRARRIPLRAATDPACTKPAF